jgi:hypothetical protein
MTTGNNLEALTHKDVSGYFQAQSGYFQAQSGYFQVFLQSLRGIRDGTGPAIGPVPQVNSKARWQNAIKGNPRDAGAPLNPRQTDPERGKDGKTSGAAPDVAVLVDRA